MSGVFTPRNIVTVALLAGLTLLPLYVSLTDDRFLLTLFTRIVILAIAAVSLNLILGYGGMMSFGHAAYLGIGGYTVAILAFEGVQSGFVQWPAALAASAVFALVIGALSLRTRGVYFIMITLAFAQMAYYLASGMARYGSDDGLGLDNRSQFGGLIDLSNKTAFYYVCLFLLFGSIFLVWRLTISRFGMVLRGTRSNETRMLAIGFPVYRYKLAAFVIAGTLCGLSGALIANHTEFVSPAMMFWTRSGDLMVMVVLGGMGSLFGPLFGAVALLFLEQFLPAAIHAVVQPFNPAGAVKAGEYWQIVLGPLLLLVVLFARGGIDGLLRMLSSRERHG
ncbi:MAG TPA: branched-chain amino acid ABC transporter permease [Pseudolabrys sp.]|nr:branched-chain amino acid ABC transporter permease [Pseudolabrys sp.]